MDAPRPTRHIRGSDLRWFDFDPSEIAEIARAFADEYPDLADRLASCRRAAWKCDAYLAFEDTLGKGGVHTAVIWTDDGEDYAVDIDRAGRPVGIEFLARLPCRSG